MIKGVQVNFRIKGVNFSANVHGHTQKGWEKMINPF